ncbi:MAG: hypothetical protein FJ000_01865, partial [Actinobacteria bacterium]|nr:hypothetical protein [Actinomycetota bacterium]
LRDEVEVRPGGIIERRAGELLGKAVEQLEHVQDVGLFRALEMGEFADVSRDPGGGRGFDGVVKRSDDYFNPFYAALREGRMSGPPAGPTPAERATSREGGR